jgi:hypothetical protein
METNYCSYYRAQLVRKKIWFLTGCLRNADHIAFERTPDRHEGDKVEFFVPRDREQEFLGLMDVLDQRGCIVWLRKVPNRLNPDETPDSHPD